MISPIEALDNVVMLLGGQQGKFNILLARGVRARITMRNNIDSLQRSRKRLEHVMELREAQAKKQTARIKALDERIKLLERRHEV